jgi:hypothetical protein
MIHTKPEKVLLVAPGIFSLQILNGNKQIKHVTSVDRVFPSIYEMAPNIIVFDYDYLSKDMEKILRRIRANSYYNKIRICCFKSSPERRLDSFLKVLGVNHLIYKHELHNPTPTALSHIRSILDPATADLMVNAFC